jgi:HAE1 family hydrophobic/amphiphilic exporter-1
MSLTRGAVGRPVLTSILFLTVIALGVISYTRLSIDLMPEISFPTISVVTSYGEVGPLEMEEQVTRPLEESLAAVQGVEEITSTSSEGRSQVRVSFAWGTNLDEATNDIRDRVDRVMSRLPDDIERPQIRKFDVTAFPIVVMGISSAMNPLDLRRFAEDQVKYRLERIPGVAAADIRGGLTREIHVDLSAARLKALGLSPAQVVDALAEENRNMPAGTYDRGNLEILVRTEGEYRSLDEIRETVVASPGGTPVRVGDLARVVDSWEEVTRIDRIDGKPGLRIAINKQSGANTVGVAEAVRAEVELINRDFPQARITLLVDNSVYIRRSIASIGDALLIGGLLAVLILFFFLRSITSTLIISTAIPVSVVATFGLMHLGGLTLNIITFGGLALGIGMLVDNAIVVLENVYRHRESGADPLEAVLVGSGEVGAAIMASTLTTVVVFLPVVFMRGVSGVLYQQMALVVTFSLLCSLVVALTLVPVLSARFLRHHRPGGSDRTSLLGRIYAGSEGLLCRLEDGYGALLARALRRRTLVIAAAAVLLALSVFLVRRIGVELMPSADEGEVQVNLEMAVGTRLELSEAAVKQVEEIVRREVSEAVTVVSEVGGGGFGGGAGHTSQVRVMLTPKKERRRSSQQVADDLRKKIGSLPGVTTRVRAGQGLFLLRVGSGQADSVSVEVRGYDLAAARGLARKVEEAVRRVAGITDTRISRGEGSPEQVIRVDRARAADLGLSVSRIGGVLETAVGGTGAGAYREGGREHPIRVRLAEEDRGDLADLLDLTVVNDRGRAIPLANVVETRPREGPVRIERKDQERIITISANFTGRDLGSVIADIRRELASVTVPRDFAVLFGGDWEEQQKAFRELMIGFILAVFLVYMVMAGQFESYRDPFIILFSIPMALIGVTVTMILSKTIFSIQAFIGCIILAGIVVNNAIILVDYTNLLRRRDGLPLAEAIRLAGARRLRPILMTTLTTVLGLLPLSLGLGEGGEAQAPMARVVIGGLSSATLVTLFLIPVVYSLFEGFGRKAPGESTPVPVPPEAP